MHATLRLPNQRPSHTLLDRIFPLSSQIKVPRQPPLDRHRLFRLIPDLILVPVLWERKECRQSTAEEVSRGTFRVEESSPGVISQGTGNIGGGGCSTAG